MEKEILKSIRDNVTEQQKKQNEYQKSLQKIKELEKNEYVKEYLELKKRIQDNNLDKSEDSIILSAYSKYRNEIKETNNVIICLGTYRKCYNSKLVEDDIVVCRNEPYADYRIYVDIEKYPDNIIIIPIDECEKFEKENNVVIPKTYISDYQVSLIQKEFIKETLKSSQEEAKIKVINKIINR